MSRINDVGGMDGFALPGAMDDDGPFHSDWEAHVFAIMRALIRQEVLVLDEVRDAIEQMPPADYLASSYYARWLYALQVLLVDKGVLTRSELAEVGEHG